MSGMKFQAVNDFEKGQNPEFAVEDDGVWSSAAVVGVEPQEGAVDSVYGTEDERLYTFDTEDVRQISGVFDLEYDVLVEAYNREGEEVGSENVSVAGYDAETMPAGDWMVKALDHYMDDSTPDRVGSGSAAGGDVTGLLEEDTAADGGIDVIR